MLVISLVSERLPKGAWTWARFFRPRPLAAAMLVAGIVLLVGGLLAFGGSWWAYHRRRVIADTPTSKVRSMAVGDVELAGTATIPPSAQHQRGPFTDEPCVYWEYEVEEKRTRHTKSGTQTYWATVTSGRSRAPIAIKDDTGVAVVEQRGGDLPTTTESRFGSGWGRDPTPRIIDFLRKADVAWEGLFGMNKTMRYTERRLMEGTPIFVLGTWTGTVVDKSGSRTFLVSTGGEKAVLRKWTGLFWLLFLLGVVMAASGAYLAGQ